MKFNYFQRKSLSAQGRSELRVELLSQIRAKLDLFLKKIVVVENQLRAAAIFDKAFSNVKSESLYTLFQLANTRKYWTFVDRIYSYVCYEVTATIYYSIMLPF